MAIPQALSRESDPAGKAPPVRRARPDRPEIDIRGAGRAGVTGPSGA